MYDMDIDIFIPTWKGRNFFMETGQFIISIIGAVLGSGGIAAVITAILSTRKYKAEARRMEQDTQKDLDRYVNDKLKEVTNMYINETQQLKRSNEQLHKQIEDLQDKIQSIMSWIINENYTNISILKAKIQSLDPNFEFPEMRPCLNPWAEDDEQSNQHNNNSDGA